MDDQISWWWLQTSESCTLQISQNDYDRWSKKFIFEAITGQRYGQSFCNYFGIKDYALFFERDIDWCKRYIKSSYLKTN